MSFQRHDLQLFACNVLPVLFGHINACTLLKTLEPPSHWAGTAHLSLSCWDWWLAAASLALKSKVRDSTLSRAAASMSKCPSRSCGKVESIPGSFVSGESTIRVF
jgi:hypothetical protein